MERIRTAMVKQPGLVALLLVATLCMKFLVPPGWMIAPTTKSFAISICSDGLGQRLTTTIDLPVHDPRGDPSGQTAKAQCPFGGLALALAAPLVALLAAALTFAMALGFAPITPPRLNRSVRFRPPLRGPPQLR